MSDAKAGDSCDATISVNSIAGEYDWLQNNLLEYEPVVIALYN